MGRKIKRKSKSNVTLKSSTSKNNVLKNQVFTDETNSSAGKLIRIIDRLSLPPYHIEELDDEESELQLDFQPRPYFVSSLCYVCSKFCDNFQFPCENCCMVFYCSAKHREENVEDHKQLCKVLAEICLKNNGLALAKNLSADDYRIFRVELLQIVENALGRRLELWEREILLYPRLCRLCHASDDLEVCPDCQMEFFCRRNNNEHRGNHINYCDEFKIFRSILSVQKKNGSVTPRIPDFMFHENHKFPENFDEFVREIYALRCDYEKIDCASYAALSQVASPALTSLYAMQITQHCNQNMKRKVFKIHIIGAELQFECANLTVWEKLFLHLLPGVKSLKLEFCGPELHVPLDIARILERPKLCSSCRAKNRKIDIVFHCGKLYHQVENDKPDLVCLFNPGLYRTTGFANQDTWPPTIEKFCDYGVPILVTSYTEVELPRDLSRMRIHRDVQIEQEPRRNPFASLKPERNFVSDDLAPLIYKNYFLSVAKGIPANVQCK